MEACDADQFGTCITCKCYKGSIQRFMINVLCWSPESTTYELRSEHTKSIFSRSLHTPNLLPAALSALWRHLQTFFFFNIMTARAARRRSGPVVWVQDAWRVSGWTVACVGLSGSHICVRLCTICVKMNICHAKQSRMMSISGHL